MEKELLTELNQIRKDLGIPVEEYIKIVALAKMRRNKSKIHISDEMLYEIIIDALSSYDYKYEEENKNVTIDAIKTLIAGEREQRHLSDQMLFDLIEDNLNMLAKNENKKNNNEIVDRAVKSLGI